MEIIETCSTVVHTLAKISLQHLKLTLKKTLHKFFVFLLEAIAKICIGDGALQCGKDLLFHDL